MVKRLVKEYRLWLILLFHLAAIAAGLLTGFLMRFDFYLPAQYTGTFFVLLPVAILVKMPIFWQQGIFRGWWRYASMADVLHLGRANLIASMAFVLVLFLLDRADALPRSVLILDGLNCFAIMVGVRFVTRAFRENYLPMPLQGANRRTSKVLIIGAGSAGQTIAREIRLNPGLEKQVVGFIDDSAQKIGRHFVGFRVLGNMDDLQAACRRQGVNEIIIAVPSASGQVMRDIVEQCKAVGVRFKTLPGVGELIDGSVSVNQVRDVALEDLLGRKPIHLELDRIRHFLAGKRILVTGAAGSIGSEICRQVGRFAPERLILYDHAESPLFHLQRELAALYPELCQRVVIGDIRDRARVEGIFADCRPQVVFHAAAYKHVPMMEGNPAEAANNNVRGTRVVAEAADCFGVESFVMISTDKAVNPTNVMGASKRAAEMVVQNLSRDSKTSYVTVRFGNVLGSAGSVVPIFQEQIRQGGPVTVTHRDVTRFFMSIPEATQLVLQAGSMGKGGEIYLLNMGEPVRIADLAEELIRLSGLVPGEDIEIRYTGLRPGEKLFEELLIAGEGVKPTSHEKIMVAESKVVDRQWLLARLEELYALQRVIDQPGVIAKLREIVPEFVPENAGEQKVVGYL